MSTVTALKVRIGTEVRRVGIKHLVPTEETNVTDFEDFVARVLDLFSKPSAKVERVQYTDEEGDLITVSTSVELAEALRTPSVITLSMNILLEEHSQKPTNTQPCFPPFVPPFFTAGNDCGLFADLSTDDGELRGLFEAIQQVVQQSGGLLPSFLLFSGGMGGGGGGGGAAAGHDFTPVVQYLEQHPNCLQKLQPIIKNVIVTLQTAPPLPLPLPPIENLVNSIVVQLMDFAEQESYVNNQKMLYSLCGTILSAATGSVPDNCVLYYNHACVEARLNNIEESLRLLNTAVGLGYTKVEHIQADADLENLRGLDEFNNIIQRLTAGKKTTTTTTTAATAPKPPSAFYRTVLSVNPSAENNEEHQATTATPDVDKNVHTAPPVDDTVAPPAKKVKYATQVEVLKNMGFGMKEEALDALLDSKDGNMAAVIEMLL